MTASRGDSVETAEGDLGPVDPLSGLADRDFFDAQLAAALADPAIHATVGLIVLEIDQFEALHDLHGDTGWDAVLVGVARGVRERVGDAGVIARTGVNEIAIVVTDAPDSTTVAALAERLRVALAATRLRAGSLRLRVTASFGVAHSGTSGPEPERLASVADAALSRSRAAGRNRVTSIAIDVAATLPQGMTIAK
jgi:diguanylate cyclase (GGDEF)-like protein